MGDDGIEKTTEILGLWDGLSSSIECDQLEILCYPTADCCTTPSEKIRFPWSDCDLQAPALPSPAKHSWPQRRPGPDRGPIHEEQVSVENSRSEVQNVLRNSRPIPDE